jgi:class 3 adenylate cyclase/tetratricopeptide (TPR) repeat protein
VRPISNERPAARRLAVVTCPACGRENDPDARFCAGCGTPLGRTAAGAEARKVVTVFFTDVADSTALGERLDPELLRRVMWRYFDVVQGVLERHGGTVEKFIGDAVMAVFGVPVVREDDALRAVRAAVELGDALEALDEELSREHGIRIVARTGINTGEVIVGGGRPDQKLATGDAVNVAARLEQAAAPGEVLLGAATYAAVADAVDAEPAPSVTAKGKSEPLVAYRLAGLRPDVPAFFRPIATPFVGRGDELGRLRTVFEESVATRAPRLATIVGVPGVGKSRLARELLGGLREQARVLVGRCTPYGEGISYLPLADVVRDAGDVEQALREVDHGEVAARLVRGAVGAREGGGSPDETAWAYRRLFEVLAAPRPLVLVVDDIHWADPALLDLVEYVAASSSDAPIFVLCTARPDLLDLRPTWAAPRPGSTLVMLGPLGAQDADALVDALGGELPPALHERVVAAAEGNPLFVEQLLAHVADDPETETVPPTIQALLAARIDRLEPEERAVVQCGAVEGRLFHRGAVAELLEDGAGAAVGATLLSLARKEFVRPDRSLFAGDDGFRFNHVLIRDVAYSSMPKELRSRLHERLADWLEARNGHLAGHDEIVGYHLEQAYRLGVELGRPDNALALRAGRLLRRAGEAALGRHEAAAATGLLRRAAELLATDPVGRASLLTDLGAALRDAGSLLEAEQVFAEAVEQARVVGDELAELRAAVEQGHLMFMRGTGDAEDLRLVAQRAIDAFRTDADLADAWQLMGTARLRARDRAGQLEALLRAREHAVASGDVRRQIEAWDQVGGSMLFGRTPLAEVKTFIDEELAWAREHGLPALEADALLAGPYVDARLGDFDLGREKLERSKAICRDLGIAYGLAEAHMAGAELEVLAGDLPAAERELRDAISVAADMDADHYVAMYRLRLARVLLDQGRPDDAAGELDGAAMLYAERPEWMVSRARVLAAEGRLDEAVALAREATEMDFERDNVTIWALKLVDLSRVLDAAGDRAGAEAALEQAVGLNDEKGNVVAARQCREQLARLRAAG